MYHAKGREHRAESRGQEAYRSAAEIPHASQPLSGRAESGKEEGGDYNSKHHAPSGQQVGSTEHSIADRAP